MRKKVGRPAYDKVEYANRFATVRANVAVTRDRVNMWLKNLELECAGAVTRLAPLLSLFPQTIAGEYSRISFEIHSSNKRYGTLGIVIKTNSKRTDLGCLDRSGVKPALKAFCKERELRLIAPAVADFNELMNRVSGLRSICEEQFVRGEQGTVLTRWYEGIGAYGERCTQAVNEAFEIYEALSNDLEEAVFAFNHAAGRMRYRTVRCVFEVEDNDPLGPANPSFKVVTSINPRTRAIRYNHLVDFKNKLRSDRIKKALELSLDRAPTADEIKVALQRNGNRRPCKTLTTDVIKACHLGRRAKELYQAQDHLLAVMKDWSDLRSKLQALL